MTLSGVSVAKTDTSAINKNDATLVSFFDFEENEEVTAGSKAVDWKNLLVPTIDEAGNYGTLSTNHYLYAKKPDSVPARRMVSPLALTSIRLLCGVALL